jgi:diamine N-acetyltransferase
VGDVRDHPGAVAGPLTPILRHTVAMTTTAPVVNLREITPANRSAIEALTVTEAQDEFVTGVADSLVEAADTPDACPWFRAIYADDEPVGFVMITDGITVVNPEYLGPYFLWRLLIDQRYQGRGYGSAALWLAIDHVRTRADARVFLTSAVLTPGSPVDFYLGHGFRLTGVVHVDGESVLELDLSTLGGTRVPAGVSERPTSPVPDRT